GRGQGVNKTAGHIANSPGVLAQWQSSGLLIRWFRVRAPGAPLLNRDVTTTPGQPADRVAVWVAVGFTARPTAPARSARRRRSSLAGGPGPSGSAARTAGGPRE